MTTVDDAKTCIALLRQREQDEGYRIGRVERAFSGSESHYSLGEIVLFRDYDGNKEKVIVESPIPFLEVKEGGELTRRVVNGVPRSYVGKR